MPIKSWRTGWIFGCCLFIWISCNRTGNDNPRLEKALSLSGSNRQELEKVLHHFSQNPSDSLYLKAAIFLIENMPGHWSPSLSILFKTAGYAEKPVTSHPENTFDLSGRTSWFVSRFYTG